MLLRHSSFTGSLCRHTIWVFLLSSFAISLLLPTVAFAENCTFGLSAGVQKSLLGSAAGNITWRVQASPAGCKWTLTNANSWITSVTPTSGTGGSVATITAAWQTNSSSSQRSGDIVLTSGTSTYTLTITQNTTLCSWTPSPTRVSFPWQGGSVPTPVTAKCWSGLNYDQVPSVKGNTSYIAATPFSDALSADANPTTQTRSGTVRISNSSRTIAVTQPPAAGSTPSLSAISCNSPSVQEGQNLNCSVTLTAAAPTGGATVTLTSSNTAALTVQSPVTVSSGAITAPMTVSAQKVSAAASVTVTGTYAGTSKTTTVQVTPALPTISNLTCLASSLTANQSTTCTVTLTGPAPTGGVQVGLSSSSTSLSVKPSLTVPANASAATFSADALNFTSASTATITAEYNSTSRKFAIQLVTGALTLMSVACPTTLNSGASGSCTVTLSGNAPTGGVPVALSDDSPLLTTPMTVMVPASASSATFSVTAGTITTATNAIVTATYNSVSKTASIQMRPPVAAPALSSLSCAAMTLYATQSTTCTVMLVAAAPTGGVSVSLTSSSPQLPVGPSVTVAANATTATFTATAGSISAAAVATLTATLNGVSKTAPVSLTPLPSLTSVSCATLSLGPGQTTTCTVVLSAGAPTGGAAVTVSSSAASLNAPATVTVTAGQTSATFTVTGAATIAAAETAVLMARYNGATQTESIFMVPSASLTRLSCTPPTLTSGQTFTCTVNLSSAAPTGGVTVTIASDNAAVPVPATITVPASGSSQSFSGTAGSVTAAGTATIIASARGAQQTAKIFLSPPVTLSSVTCSAKSLSSGDSASCTVGLSAGAPSSGANVTLSSNNTAVTLSTPSVAVAAGSSTGTFKVTAGALSADASATIAAVYGGVSKTATIALTVAITVNTLACSPTSIGAGQSGTCTVTLSGAAPAGGASVALASNNASVTVPSAVTVLAASSSASFSATLGTITTAAIARITASYNTSSKTFSVNLTPPQPILKAAAWGADVQLSAGRLGARPVGRRLGHGRVGLQHRVRQCASAPGSNSTELPGRRARTRASTSRSISRASHPGPTIARLRSREPRPASRYSSASP